MYNIYIYHICAINISVYIYTYVPVYIIILCMCVLLLHVVLLPVGFRSHSFPPAHSNLGWRNILRKRSVFPSVVYLKHFGTLCRKWQLLFSASPSRGWSIEIPRIISWVSNKAHGLWLSLTRCIHSPLCFMPFLILRGQHVTNKAPLLHSTFYSVQINGFISLWMKEPSAILPLHLDWQSLSCMMKGLLETCKSKIIQNFAFLNGKHTVLGSTLLKNSSNLGS